MEAEGEKMSREYTFQGIDDFTYKSWEEMTDLEKKLNAIRGADDNRNLRNQVKYLRKLLLVQNGYKHQDIRDLESEVE